MVLRPLPCPIPLSPGLLAQEERPPFCGTLGAGSPSGRPGSQPGRALAAVGLGWVTSVSLRLPAGARWEPVAVLQGCCGLGVVHTFVRMPLILGGSPGLPPPKLTSCPFPLHTSGALETSGSTPRPQARLPALPTDHRARRLQPQPASPSAGTPVYTQGSDLTRLCPRSSRRKAEWVASRC